MAMIDKLPQAFWTQASLNFKKFKKGSLPLDECYEAQRKLYISQVDKLEKDQSNVEAQKKIKMDKAKKIEKVMERLQRQSLLSQKQNQKTGQDTAEVKQSAGKDEAPAASTSDPEVKKEDEEVAKTETNPKGSQYKCDGCEFESNLLNAFENHISTNHPLYKPFKCKQCEYSSNKRQNLHKHIKSVHK